MSLVDNCSLPELVTDAVRLVIVDKPVTRSPTVLSRGAISEISVPLPVSEMLKVCPPASVIFNRLKLVAPSVVASVITDAVIPCPESVPFALIAAAIEVKVADAL